MSGLAGTAFEPFCDTRGSALTRSRSMKLATFVFALIPGSVAAAPHPFDVHDLVMMDRVSDPQISPDGKRVAYQLRETDYAANKGVNSVWVASLKDRSAKPVRWGDSTLSSQTSPRWSPDGTSLFVLASSREEPSTQVWRVAVTS